MISPPVLVIWHVPLSYAVVYVDPDYLYADLTTSNNDANGHVKLYIIIIVFRGLSVGAAAFRPELVVAHAVEMVRFIE